MKTTTNDIQDSTGAGNRGCLRRGVGIGLGLLLGALAGIVLGLLLGVGIAMAFGIL